MINLKIENANEHQQEAFNYLQGKQASWQDQNTITEEIISLNMLRKSVKNDDISKNPLGQILEPGFRVIFPTIIP